MLIATHDQTERFELDVKYVRPCPELSWTDASGNSRHAITGRMLVGSAAEAELRVQDRAVSRIHAELDVDADGVWVRDLDSLNGTFVEGIRVREALVPDGATIGIGRVQLQMTIKPNAQEVELWPDVRYGELLGAGRTMREVFARLNRVAASDAPTLLFGETGTGKELAARAIHQASRRCQAPFITVDCAALPENLLESELFGHTKGAFTGATNSRAGCFEAANGGTVFLDEVGELPMSMQPKLLRVLENATIRRLGEVEYRNIDVRVIAATHRNLLQLVSIGAFREDLYFRLAVLPATLPPLRARREDIPLLAEHFLAGRSAEGLDVAELSRQPWLGNTRELRNFVERACALGAVSALTALDEATQSDRLSSPPDGSQSPLDRELHRHCRLPFSAFRSAWLEAGEREYLLSALKRFGHKVSKVASFAEVDRTYVYRLMRKHGL